MSKRSVVSLAFVLACSVWGATDTFGQSTPPIPERTVDLAEGVPIPGLPFTGILASPFTCSSGGQIFVDELGLDKQGRLLSTMPVLYRVSSPREVKQVSIPAPTGYKEVSSSSFFAGSDALVSLVRASQPTDQSNAQSNPAHADYFLATSDLDGDHGRLIHVSVNFDVAKAALFDSGEFIVLGSDVNSLKPVIALLNWDGRLLKRLDVFSKPAADSPAADTGLVKGDATKATMSLRSIAAVKFVPWGSDVLMVAPGFDDSAIYHFRPSSRFDRIPVKLPEGEMIEGIVAAGGSDDWVIRSRTAASQKQMVKARIVENPVEHLYEVNPQSGEILRRLELKGPVPGEVACAVNGKLSAFYIGPTRQGAVNQLSLAIANR